MRRMKSRLVTALTVIAMVALLVPAMPASAALTDTGTGGPPAKVAVADAQATPLGIRVKVLDLPGDVTGIDIYRSTAAGVEGDKLNAEPVVGAEYLDETVAPATEYFYTVKVASRDAKVDPGRFDMVDTLPQVSATSREAKSAPVEAKAAKAPQSKSPADMKKIAALALPAAPPAKPEQIAAMATTVGNPSATTTLAASATWTTAMSPIFVRGDLVVPAGKTLTINPGVKVYFDTNDSGDPAFYETGSNPTSKVDLIVHGKLIAKGTSTSRVVMTSILSLPTSAVAEASLPAIGDWGCVYNDSRSASEMSYCQIEYGKGVWSVNTARPYFKNNIVQENGTDASWAYRGAVTFTNPKTDSVTPRILITGNTISSSSSYGILVNAEGNPWSPLESDYDTNTANGDLVVDPYIAYNTVKAEYGVGIWAWDEADAPGNGASYVRGTVVGNKVWSWSGSEPIYLYASTYDQKTAKVSTAFSGNTITTTGDYAVESYAYGYEGGKCYDYPTFSGDKLSAYYSAYYGYSYSQVDSETLVGGAYERPKFTNCALVSSEYDTVELYAYSDNKGNADTNATFIGGSIETASSYGVYGYCYSYYGSASSSPVFTNVYGGGHYSSEFLYLEAYAYDKGTARVNPRWTGGKIVNLDSDAVYCYAQSDEATAEAKPYWANTSVYAEYNCFDLYAYSNYSSNGNGTADVSGTFINTTMKVADNNGSDSAVYGYADASYRGAAKASPTFNKCTIRGLSYDGIEVYAYSEDGAASASPVLVNGTNLDAYNNGIYAYAYRDANDPLLTANVVASPKIDHSTVKSYYDAAVYAEARGYSKGDAIVSPQVIYSRVENHYYDGGMDLEAYKSSGATGTATISPLVDHSYLFGSGDYCVDISATGPRVVAGGGTSKSVSAGTYKYSTLENDYNDDIYGYVYNYGGTGEFTPLIQDCAMIAGDDNAVSVDVYAYGTGGYRSYNAPTFLRDNLTNTADGIELDAYANSATATSTAVCAPYIKDCSIYATWDYPVETNAEHSGAGDATNNTYIYNTTMKAYDGVYNAAQANTGDAYNNAKVLGKSTSARATIEAFYDDGVYNYTYSSSGDAADRTQSKYLKIDCQYDGVNSYTDAPNAQATIAPVISGNAIGTKWTAEDIGVYVECYGVDTVVTPSITSNSIGAVNDEGVYVYNSSTNAKFSPVVTGNTIGSGTLGVGSDGIYLYNSWSTELPGSSVTVSKNAINYPYGNGIELSGVTYGVVSGNKIQFPAFHNSSSGWFDTGGVNWSGAGAETSPTAALVKGNLITNARLGVVYDSGWATTQYNSFSDAYGNMNRPWSLGTNKSGLPTPKLDARYNWWGTTNATAITDSINAWNAASASDGVDYTMALTQLKPKVTSIVKSKSGSTYTFKVTFDRAMDTSVKYLRFGKSSPYKTYKTKNGTWSNGDKTLTVKFTGSLSAGKYYFSGAKDLPGTAMDSKSKYFQP